MFGFFKKRYYTGRPTETMTKEGRAHFIRRLVRERFAADPVSQLSVDMMGEDIDSLSEIIIMSSPDASLVRIAERLVGGRQKGVDDHQIIEVTHNEFKSAMELTSPFPFLPVPQPIDLWGYARYFLDTQHGHGVHISDAYIDYVFKETFQFYNFSGTPHRVVPPPHDY